jgi:hypothetical protein
MRVLALLDIPAITLSGHQRPSGAVGAIPTKLPFVGLIDVLHKSSCACLIVVLH